MIKNDTFFFEKTIHIEIEGFPKETFRMRPLKICELPGYFEFVEKRGDFIDVQLIFLLEKILGKSIRDMPIEVIPKLLEELLILSFPEQEKRLKKSDGGEEFNFAEMFDFLISQGHSHSEILQYTIPQFSQYIEAAVNRLTGKKKKLEKDSLKTLRSMGIPIRGKKNGRSK